MEVLEWYESTPEQPRTLQYDIKQLDVSGLTELLYLQELVNDRVVALLEEIYELNNPGYWYTYAYV